MDAGNEKRCRAASSAQRKTIVIRTSSAFGCTAARGGCFAAAGAVTCGPSSCSGPPMASPEQPAAQLEQLIARCAAGDSAALKLLYQNTSAQLFGVLKRILLRADLAEEALQDVYVSIWRNAKDYRASKGAVFTWMTSIARYRAIDIKRSRRREVSFADPERLRCARISTSRRSRERHRAQRRHRASESLPRAARLDAAQRRVSRVHERPHA